MTTGQTSDNLFNRMLAPCRCGADACDGRPETGLKVADLYPADDPVDPAARPLASPYLPTRVGELVRDTRTGRLGSYQDRQGGRIYLRPVGGGCEWTADPRFIDRAPEAGPSPLRPGR
ncbi:hypothetical protein GCM10009760_50200 [Kitasatospora kazusensis]|uniref:Uncharacterized protein n=1 Tax=Kitasatospora kazusensis TaxID=407974 RepID=A0ABP5LS82_9ACTN